MKIRVLIGDDHQIVRSGLRALLDKESDMEVVGEAENGSETVRVVTELSPDVVVMDVCMPDLNGIEATHQITANNPNIKVLALSMYEDKRFVLRMIQAGAFGYLLKNCAYDELVQAIRTVSVGKPYLCKSLSDILIEDYFSQLLKGDYSQSNVLTTREREVLQLLAEGKTTRQIAAMLHLSIKTVETHRYGIMNRLDIHTIAGLTKFAVRHGFTPP
jgi:two-component system response regulator NreC